jgi:predicted membrane protein
MIKWLIIISFIIISTPSHAYLGPGMSGGVIAAVIGFIAAIFLGIFGIIYYPIKRALKKRKKEKDAR